MAQKPHSVWTVNWRASRREYSAVPFFCFISLSLALVGPPYQNRCVRKKKKQKQILLILKNEIIIFFIYCLLLLFRNKKKYSVCVGNKVLYNYICCWKSRANDVILQQGIIVYTLSAFM